MRKINVFGLLILLSVGLFIACTEDENALGPSITLSGTGEFISDDITVAPGDPLPFSWTATKGDANLDLFNIYRDEVVLGNWEDIEIPSGDNDTYIGTATLTAPNNEGSYTYTFEVTDKDGKTGKVEVVVTVEEAAVQTILTWTKKLYNGLWYSDDNKGAFFASATGEVFAQTGAADILSQTEQQKVDFLYWWGGSTNASIVAPNDNTAITSAAASEAWTSGNRNATKLKKVSSITGAWVDIDASYIETIATGFGTDTKIINLTPSDYVVFETVGGKKGIIDIVAINGSSQSKTDNIDIEVKVIE